MALLTDAILELVQTHPILGYKDLKQRHPETGS